MYGQEAVRLAEAYNDLQSYFGQTSIKAFLRECWLLPENQKFSYVSLEKLVYVEGNLQEIYTNRERQLIKANKNEIYSCDFQIDANSGTINSRIIAIKLDNTQSPILEAIAIMKILSKALDEFIIFAFVVDSSVYLGCSGLHSGGNTLDCIISPPITESMDWVLLSDVFLYRDDSKFFYKYYQNLVTTLKAIRYCYKKREVVEYNWQSFGYGDDDSPDEYYDYDAYERFKRGEYHCYNDDLLEKEGSFDVEAFEREVIGCMSELEYIVSSRTNPIELLFEAEEALIMDKRQEQEEDNDQLATEDDEPIDVDLLDDPIALMKKLRRDLGL